MLVFDGSPFPTWPFVLSQCPLSLPWPPRRGPFSLTWMSRPPQRWALTFYTNTLFPFRFSALILTRSFPSEMAFHFLIALLLWQPVEFPPRETPPRPCRLRVPPLPKGFPPFWRSSTKRPRFTSAMRQFSPPLFSFWLNPRRSPSSRITAFRSAPQVDFSAFFFLVFWSPPEVFGWNRGTGVPFRTAHGASTFLLPFFLLPPQDVMLRFLPYYDQNVLPNNLFFSLLSRPFLTNTSFSVSNWASFPPVPDRAGWKTPPPHFRWRLSLSFFPAFNSSFHFNAPPPFLGGPKGP